MNSTRENGHCDSWTFKNQVKRTCVGKCVKQGSLSSFSGHRLEWLSCATECNIGTEQNAENTTIENPPSTCAITTHNIPFPYSPIHCDLSYLVDREQLQRTPLRGADGSAKKHLRCRILSNAIGSPVFHLSFLSSEVQKSARNKRMLDEIDTKSRAHRSRKKCRVGTGVLWLDGEGNIVSGHTQWFLGCSQTS